MSASFNRGTGLIIINVVNSNPNGDPDGESEPRTFEGDGRGLISPVSFKRKLRDLMEDDASEVRRAALAAIGPPLGDRASVSWKAEAVIAKRSAQWTSMPFEGILGRPRFR